MYDQEEEVCREINLIYLALLKLITKPQLSVQPNNFKIPVHRHVVIPPWYLLCQILLLTWGAHESNWEDTIISIPCQGH